MTFVVLVATAGRAALLERTLQSLALQHLPDRFLETVVIENGPPVGAKDTVARAPRVLRVRYMHQRVANKSLALNAALESVGDAFVFFTDDDVRFEPSTLQSYADAAQRYDARHFFGGPTLAEYEEAPPDWLKEFLPGSARGWSLDSDESPTTLPFLGCNWAAHASAIRDAGMFSESVGPGSASGSVGQDTDMQTRLRTHGCTGIYLPGARVWHHVPRERCTPEWAIDRAFRHAIYRGMQEYAELQPGERTLPLWTYRKRATLMVQRALSLFGDSQTKFRARYAQREFAGLLRGLKLAAQSDRRAISR